MKYTDKLAAELAAKGVPAATIRTWKHRGQIPDEVINAEQLGRVSGEEFSWAHRVITCPMIYANRLGIPGHICNSIAKGEVTTISKDNLVRIERSVKPLAIQLKKFIRYKDDSNCIKVIQHRLVVVSPFLRQIGADWGHRIESRLSHRYGLMEGEAAALLPYAKRLLSVIQK